MKERAIWNNDIQIGEAEDILLRLSKPDTTADLDICICKYAANRISHRYHGETYIVDAEDMDQFVAAMSSFVSDYADALIKAERYHDAMELVNHCFTLLTEIICDDPDGLVSELCVLISSYWETLLASLNDKEKRQMMTWFVRMQYHRDTLCYTDMIDTVLETHFHDSQAIAEQIHLLQEKLECMITACSQPDFNCDSDRLIARYLQLLHTETSSDVCEDPLLVRYPNCFLLRHAYIRWYTGNRMYTAALRLLDDCIAAAADSPHAVYDYKRQKKDLYRCLGMTDAYHDLLWELILCDESEELLDNYRELKALYSPEEWIYVRDSVYLGQHDIEKECLLYQEEQLYDRLLVCVTDTPGITLLNQYYTVLKKDYPELLLQKYTIELYQMADLAKTRTAYRRLVAVLRKMRCIRGGKAVVKEILADWNVRYHNRSALQEELAVLSKQF